MHYSRGACVHIVRENILWWTCVDVIDLCGKKKKITMVKMYEIELECDALFV